MSDASPPPTADVIRLHPRATIGGREIEHWPSDLYIPPEALQVFLEQFEGPLDLLLYLIRKQNIDILDIPVAAITQQYMTYIELMHAFELDLAAEYLVMAATLAEIKSRLLLPRPQADEEEGEDPRAALVARLQEYERFRQAAFEMDDRPRVERDIFVARAEFDDPTFVPPQPRVAISDLVAAFSNVIEIAARNQHLLVTREALSVRERMTRILERLESAEYLRFEQLFEPSEGRLGLIVTFVAILELIKDDMLIAVQNEPFSPIHIRAVR